MTSADETPAPALPVYLVEWVVPRQRRDPQKAAAAVGTGSLVQLVRTTLAELHGRTMTTELGDFLPHLSLVVADHLEAVELERTDASWDRVNRAGTVNYSLDHPSLPMKLHLGVPVPFCPGCHGRGGGHAEGCWASDRPALPL
jgi:hypothetical protein